MPNSPVREAADPIGLPRRVRVLRTICASMTMAAGLLVVAACQSVAPPPDRSHESTRERGQADHDHPYVGMWVTSDGVIRQELLPNGRYDEARGERVSAYTGRYEVRGNRIEYWDDTGFTADGTFVTDDELHHGGMIFYRQPQ